MKNRTIIAVALASALSLPMLAQQTSTTPDPSTNNAAQQQSGSTNSQIQTGISTSPDQNAPANPSAQTATGKEPLATTRKEGFFGHLNPFARKKYIQRQLDPVKGRVNELDELTATNSRAIKDLDDRATKGIKEATLLASTADQHAVDAGNRAQLAQQSATQANSRLTTVSKAVENYDQYQVATEAEIRFRPGQTVLSKKAKDALDQMAEPMKNQKGYIVQVRGFSAGKGQAAISSSQQMANAVVRYLVEEHEIPVYRIHTLGMGNAPVKSEDGKITKTRGARVEVAVLRNSIGDLSAEPGSSSAPATMNNGSSSATTNPAPQSNNNSVGNSGNGNATGMPQSDQGNAVKPEQK